MSVPAKIETSKSIIAMVDEIRHEHENVVAGVRATVEAAIRCGDLLHQAKAKVGHGGWGAWVETNFPASDRTARAYMQLADRAEEVDRQGLADLGIEGALKQLAETTSSRLTDPVADRLDRAKDYIAEAEECHRRAFEAFEQAGVVFGPTGLELPDDLSFEDWKLIGRFVLTMARDKGAI